MHVTLSGKRASAYVMRVRLVNDQHLYEKRKSGLRETDRPEEEHCVKTGRGWSDTATCQGGVTTPRSQENMEQILLGASRKEPSLPAPRFQTLEQREKTSLLFSATPFLALVVAALRGPARQDSPCQTGKSWLL